MDRKACTISYGELLKIQAQHIKGLAERYNLSEQQIIDLQDLVTYKNMDLLDDWFYDTHEEIFSLDEQVAISTLNNLVPRGHGLETMLRKQIGLDKVPLHSVV